MKISQYLIFIVILCSITSDMLLQAYSSMSSPSLVSPCFINDKACQFALPPFSAVPQNVRKITWYSSDAYNDRYVRHSPAMLMMIDAYNILVNECVTMHMRSQVDVLTTFLVLSSLLCSILIAALQHCIVYSRFLCLLLSTSSGIFLSFLSLYCSLLRWRHSSISIPHKLHHRSFKLHMLRQ